MDLQNVVNCLGACNPKQIVNINYAFNEINSIEILDNCGNAYSNDSMQFAYSVDNICWSCYMSYDDILVNTLDLKTDFYLRAKVSGVVSGVNIDGEAFNDYSTSIAEGFEFTGCNTSTTSSNLYNPYINMDTAISLAQQMTENVACMFGIPIYYFKLAPNAGSRDITFKEYALMDVDSVKQIKMIIVDNQMPSSKPEFSDFGLDWQTDWETEISKGTFATAFGNTAQPMEGDLIYVPMMKRMWMVSGAYEEKKDAFMWNATTFKVTLVKYQEKASVDLGDTQSLVDTFVKNKYEDLFGDTETIDSAEESLSTPGYAPDTLYPVYQSDATRKYISVDGVEFKSGIIYQKGTMIADDCYRFTNSAMKSKVVYQRGYCGENATISFIITPNADIYKGTLLELGHIKIRIEQNVSECKISLLNAEKINVSLKPNSTYFVYIRWSKEMNNIEMLAAKYTHANLPPYKLQNHHYWFEVDNAQTVVDRYNIEMIQDTKSEVVLHNLMGTITNIKVFTTYIDNISEIMQMYPTNSSLIINDTARKVIDLNGVTM